MPQQPALALSTKNLPQVLPRVHIPRYDRAALRPGIVHLGLGAFHRAHQAVYTDRLIEQGDMRWGSTGVSLRDPDIPRSLQQQDGLYSVIEREGPAVQGRVMRNLLRTLHAPSENAAVLHSIADPNTHIISITVTEKGYCALLASKDLDMAHPDIQHDLSTSGFAQPKTLLGFLAAGIAKRPKNSPLAIVSCDNLPSNGRLLKKLLGQFANALQSPNPNLQAQLRNEAAVVFPCSMVDRIVPITTEEGRAFAREYLGVDDAHTIVCEPFSQWVLEDCFVGPRPRWEDVGVLLAQDVAPFEQLKLVLLNASHSAIAYAGQLCGLPTVDAVMREPRLRHFIHQLMQVDLRSSVQRQIALPAGFDSLAYCQQLLHRFTNPSLQHQTRQIASDGTQKIPLRWLPVLRASLARESGHEPQASVPNLEKALAIWLHYLEADRNAKGEEMVKNDAGAAPLSALLKEQPDCQKAVNACLQRQEVFGSHWPQQLSACAERLARYLQVLRNGGQESVYTLLAL